MKTIATIAWLITFSSAVNAAVPFCSIAEIVDNRPTLESNTMAFRKDQKLEISMKDDSAEATARWNSILNIYQINLYHGDLTAIAIVEPPGSYGFINLQDGKRIFQMQCRFEVN